MIELKKRFLLIAARESRLFGETLARVLKPYGALEVVTWPEWVASALDPVTYEFVFLDAGILADEKSLDSLAELVRSVLQRWPSARVVVTTASPTWKRAKEALQARAVDYIRQALDETDLRGQLQRTITLYIPDEGEDQR